MHITFKEDTPCDFPATTFKKGKTYSVPDDLGEKFIRASKATKAEQPASKQANQPLTPDPEEPADPAK